MPRADTPGSVGGTQLGRYLIVANQTLGGPELDRAVGDRAERGAAEFYVLVPMTMPHHEAPGWKGGFELTTRSAVTRPGGVYLEEENASSGRAAREMEEAARRQEAVLDEARGRAEQRLGQMLDRVRAAGGEAEGEVGDPDPVAAVERVLRARSFDEVIISTLPAGISRWLRMDLSSRVARMSDTPVTTVEAEAEA